MEKRYYAIEIIGSSKKRYSIKEVIRNGYIVSTSPVMPSFRSLSEATAAAEKAGIKIKKTGDSYQII